ncbi:MAG: hypothetical protein VX204_03650, partial [Candidatus Thermoplasmatota archaeon]|nr:hypothetical protein [Candidatus Thermoplasmatota archaeon]
NSTSLTVHDDERTTLVLMCSDEFTLRLHPPGLLPSAGMKSVCFQPHESQSMVNCVCSPKYGISDMWAIIVSPWLESQTGHGCSIRLSM